MKSFIASIAAAATLAAVPAFAGEFDQSSPELHQPEQSVTAMDILAQRSGVESDAGYRAADAPVLPAGSALGQGPASVAGGIPAGTQRPAVGAGGVLTGE
jgi:hypothetical protein